MKHILMSLLAIMCAQVIFLSISSSAKASSCTIPPSSTFGGADVVEYATLPFCLVPVGDCCTPESVRSITENHFDAYRENFIMNSFYTCPVELDLQDATSDIRNAILFKTTSFGAMLDASVLLDALRSIQVSTAQTFQTYTPSDQVCRFGTLTKALSATEGRVDAGRIVLSEVALARNLGTLNSVASTGRGLDNESRMRNFVERFCDLMDNNNGMTELCQVATPVTSLNHNRDIDYTRLMGNYPTINADLTDANLTQDESSAISLGHYLYGHRQPEKRTSYAQFSESPGVSNLYSELRSVFARRAAAQNTYNTQVAMRMAGSGASDQYMRAMLQQIGVSDGDTYRYLGGQNSEYPYVESSYNAQMELLTKRLYQNPAFYAGLMESKANTRRISAGIQGIGLMQDRDIYKSTERSEMLLAILVELEARKMVNDNQGVKGQ